MMTNKKIAKNMLIEIGQLKHALNILTQINGRDLDRINLMGNSIEVIWYNVTSRTHESDTIILFKGGKSAKKATRKLFTAIALSSTAGALELLEKKNAALRALIWKEVNGEDWG